MIQFHLKRTVPDLKVRISDGSRTVRTLDVPTARNAAGIQTVCWDQRIEPLPTLGGAPAGGVAPGAVVRAAGTPGASTGAQHS